SFRSRHAQSRRNEVALSQPPKLGDVGNLLERRVTYVVPALQLSIRPHSEQREKSVFLAHTVNRGSLRSRRVLASQTFARRFGRRAVGIVRKWHCLLGRRVPEKLPFCAIARSCLVMVYAMVQKRIQPFNEASSLRGNETFLQALADLAQGMYSD